MPIVPAFAPTSTAKPGQGTVLARAEARPVPAVRDGMPIAGLLARLAGFYDNEPDLHEAARRLRIDHGLKASQRLLLGPGDAGPVPFARIARRWSTGWTGRVESGLAVPAVLAGLAGSVGLLLVVGWWVFLQLDLSVGTLVLGVVLSLLCLGVAVATLATQRTEPMRDGDFDAIVQRELAKGHWALVLHRIPPGRQVGVVRLLRNGSRHRCAVARPSQRL